MDIREWLQDTADRAPPNRSDQLEVPQFITDSKLEVERQGRNYRRRKRRRTSTDTSSHAPGLDRRHDRETVRMQSRKHTHGAEHSDTSLESSSQSGSSSIASNETPAKRYERRARHKTKVDRYEPKTKKPRKGRDSRREKKSPGKRRKSNRKDDGDRTTGLVQNFQLKNRSRNGRLTLKPDPNAGIFKHGRASVQITGRGNGLPDLVFNEMNFLQRPTEHQDEIGAEVARSVKNKNKKRPHEEEISAYFTANQEVPAEDSKLAKKRQREAALPGLELHSPSAKQRQRTSPVELPERPFLGFGGKGAQAENAQTHKESSAYLSWSESARRRSSPARKASHVSQRPRMTRKSRRRRAENVGVLDERDAKGDHDKKQNEAVGTWVQTQRTQGPASVEIYQPPIASKTDRRKHNTSLTKTTLQSLPRYPSPGHNDARAPAAASVCSEELRSNYRTSDILDVNELRHGSPDYARIPYQKQRRSSGLPSNKENENPESSIDQLLRQAHTAATEQRNPPKGSLAPTAPVLGELYDVPNLPLQHLQDQERQQPVSHDHNESLQVNRHPKLPEYGRSGGNQPGWRGVHYERASATPKYFQYRSNGIYELQERPKTHQSDCNMLDIGPVVDAVSIAGNQLPTSSHQPEGFTFQSRPRSSSGIFGAQVERLERSSGGLSRGGYVGSVSMSMKTASPYGIPNGGDFQGEQPVDQQDDADDDFAGFWKPHRLY